MESEKKGSFEKVQNYFKKSKEKSSLKSNSLLNKILGNNNLGDIIFERLTLFFAVLVFLLIIFMGWEMYSIPSFQLKSLDWFFNISVWDPDSEIFGAFPAIYGTIVSSLLVC